MKCSQVRKMLVVLGPDELPAELCQHLERCSSCREFHKRSEDVRALVSLKRYERPDAGFEQRSRYAIRQALLEEQFEPAGHERAREVFAAWAMPAIRCAAATLVLALVVWRVLIPALPNLQSSLPQKTSASPVAETASFVPTNLAVDGLEVPIVPAALVRTPSNREPASVQYGPQPSRIVSFNE